MWRSCSAWRYLRRWGWRGICAEGATPGRQRQLAPVGDLGINFIDTVDVYNGGRSEEIVIGPRPEAHRTTYIKVLEVRIMA